MSMGDYFSMSIYTLTYFNILVADNNQFSIRWKY